MGHINAYTANMLYTNRRSEDDYLTAKQRRDLEGETVLKVHRATKADADLLKMQRKIGTGINMHTPMDRSVAIGGGFYKRGSIDEETVGAMRRRG